MAQWFIEWFGCCCWPYTPSPRKNSDYDFKQMQNGGLHSGKAVNNNKGDAILEVFLKYGGSEEEIDAHQLRDLLNCHFRQEFVFSGFSLDLSRSMVAMHDLSMDGRLDIDEFRELWKDLHQWKDAFVKHDVQRKGYFHTEEFEEILKDIGLRVNEQTIKAISVRYSDKAGHVRFDDFISCAVRLKLFIETFNEQKNRQSNLASFSGDEFFQLAYS